MTNGSLMKDKSITECFPWNILQYFRPVLSKNWSYKTTLGSFFSDLLRHVLLYIPITFVSCEMYLEILTLT